MLDRRRLMTSLPGLMVIALGAGVAQAQTVSGPPYTVEVQFLDEHDQVVAHTQWSAMGMDDRHTTAFGEAPSWGKLHADLTVSGKISYGPSQPMLVLNTTTKRFTSFQADGQSILMPDITQQDLPPIPFATSTWTTVPLDPWMDLSQETSQDQAHTMVSHLAVRIRPAKA